MNRKIILLVEDTPTLAAEIAELLKMQDYEVMNACNGVQGLAVLATVKPDLIITDILMPQMDGFEMLQRIKDKPSLKEIPTVLLTAKTGQEIAERAAAIGVSTVLRKPCRATVLLDAVKALID